MKEFYISRNSNSGDMKLVPMSKLEKRNTIKLKRLA